MNPKKMATVLKLHRKWLTNEKGGVRADLRGADLEGCNLRGADLRGADLRGCNLLRADLREADLREADLREADLQGCDFRGCDLQGCNLRGADLQGCNLQGCNLRGADLGGCDFRGCDFREADLGGCNLRGADLRGCIHDSTTLWPDFQLPSGKMIGYKKVRGGVVLTLEISEKRTASVVGDKCRCRSAKVIGSNIEEEIQFASIYNPTFIYRVGETVCVDNWSDDFTIECAPGIHFFKTYEEALGYWL